MTRKGNLPESGRRLSWQGIRPYLPGVLLCIIAILISFLGGIGAAAVDDGFNRGWIDNRRIAVILPWVIVVCTGLLAMAVGWEGLIYLDQFRQFAAIHRILPTIKKEDLAKRFEAVGSRVWWTWLILARTPHNFSDKEQAVELGVGFDERPVATTYRRNAIFVLDAIYYLDQLVDRRIPEIETGPDSRA
jgi:hypothetical protein